MAEGVAITRKDAARLGQLSASEHARSKNTNDLSGAGAVSLGFAPLIARITSTIPARSGTTPGSGTVEMWKITDDELEQNAAENTKTAYNLTTSSISATTANPVYGVAVQVRGGAFVLMPSISVCEGLKSLTGYSTAPTNPLVLMVTTGSTGCSQWVAASTCT